MRTIVFVDGQNLYHLARAAWSPGPQVPASPYGYPSYDVEKLAAWLVDRDARRVLQQIRVYTGVPEPRRGQATFWHGFWGKKLLFLGGRGVYVYRLTGQTGKREELPSIEVASVLVARGRASTSASPST